MEGRNSVLIETASTIILYEKLANTIHSGEKGNLRDLQAKVESVKYNPHFESDSLKKGKGKELESLVLNVTESCNLACSYCIYSGKYENERVESNVHMDFKTAKKAVDLFMPLSKKAALISFYGGEPLNNISLIKQIIEYIKKTYQNGFLVFSMASNFCDVDLDTIRAIVKDEIHVNISLDGPKSIHDKNRIFKDGRPTYDRIMENIRRFEEFSPGYARTHFSYNATCKNPKDFPRIVRFFQENEQFVHPRINGIELKGLKVEIEKGNVSDVFAFTSDYLDSILSGKDPGVLRVFFDRNLRKIALRDTKAIPETLMLQGSCYPGNKKLFVDTDGTFYMCERFGGRAPIGNVNEGINQDSIDEIINRFQDIRNNHCTNDCWAQRLCTPCIQTSKDPLGNISGNGLAQTCESGKSQIVLALAQYVSLSEKREALGTYINSMKFK